MEDGEPDLLELHFELNAPVFVFACQSDFDDTTSLTGLRDRTG